MAVKLAQAKRPETVGVSDADNFSPAGEHYHGKGALQATDGSHQGLIQSQLQIADKQVQKNLAVHGGLKNRPCLFQLGFQVHGH